MSIFEETNWSLIVTSDFPSVNDAGIAYEAFFILYVALPPVVSQSPTSAPSTNTLTF